MQGVWHLPCTQLPGIPSPPRVILVSFPENTNQQRVLRVLAPTQQLRVTQNSHYWGCPGVVPAPQCPPPTGLSPSHFGDPSASRALSRVQLRARRGLSSPCAWSPAVPRRALRHHPCPVPGVRQPPPPCQPGTIALPAGHQHPGAAGPQVQPERRGRVLHHLLW